MGQVLCPEKRQEKHRGTGRTVAHTHRGRESRGRTHPHTTATALRRRTTGRAGKAQGTPQGRRTGAVQTEHTEESTREYTRVHRGVL